MASTAGSRSFFGLPCGNDTSQLGCPIYTGWYDSWRIPPSQGTTHGFIVRLYNYLAAGLFSLRDPVVAINGATCVPMLVHWSGGLGWLTHSQRGHTQVNGAYCQPQSIAYTLIGDRLAIAQLHKPLTAAIKGSGCSMVRFIIWWRRD